MRTTTFLCLLVLLAGVAGAQTMMPIPSYGSSFSSASATRGFYFLSPVDFTIVGLRVPDEKNHGLQNVAVIKPPQKPPAYPTTTTGGFQFYKGGEPSANIIPCSVSVKKGEYVGVLGACGDSTMMHNSYGTPSGAYLSSVLGVATSIHRFGSQTNLVVTQGQGAYYCIDTGTVSRVEVYVASASVAGSGSGAPGTTITFTLSAAVDAGRPYQLGTSLGNGPIPIDTRQLGLSPDSILVASVSGFLPTVFQDYAGVLDAQGSAQAKLNIPNVPALTGVRLYTAFVTILASAPSGVSSISNSFLFTIQ